MIEKKTTRHRNQKIPTSEIQVQPKTNEPAGY